MQIDPPTLFQIHGRRASSPAPHSDLAPQTSKADGLRVPHGGLNLKTEKGGITVP